MSIRSLRGSGPWGVANRSRAPLVEAPFKPKGGIEGAMVLSFRTAGALVGILAACGSAGAQELRPDIITRTNELYDHDIVTNIVPGRTHLRLSNATANI